MKENHKTPQDLLFEELLEEPRKLTSEQQTDTQTIYGLDQKGNSIYMKIILHQLQFAEVTFCLRLNNGYVYKLPNEPQILLCSISSAKWKAGGLSFKTLEPFRRIRIAYNGLLRRKKSQSESNEQLRKVEHVKFNFIWNAADKPLYFLEDASSPISLTKFYHNLKKSNLLSSESGYEQYGVLQGFVSGEAFSKDWVLHLPSFRKRYWGIGENYKLHQDRSIFIVAEDGTLFNIGTKVHKKEYRQCEYGTMLDNIANIFLVKEPNINFGDKASSDIITIILKAKKKTYRSIININLQSVSTTLSDAGEGWELTTFTGKCKLDTQYAVVLANFWYSKRGSGVDLPVPLLKAPQIDTVQHWFTAPFKSKECRNAFLAGGKGSSLALASTLNSSSFIIPEGFVVMALSFDYQLEQNRKLRQAVAYLEDVSRGKIKQDLAKACQETVGLFSSEPVNPETAQAILQGLRKIDNGFDRCRWAVRSSGLTEDLEQLSSAGQNATILGCATESDILRAVATCWGSLFTFQSVQYRRQHGLEVNTSMAVVIQRMIAAESAGVISSYHPTTGDPSKIVITANYGIGKSVVSGLADPDTIVLNRTWLNDISIHSKTVGSKIMHVQMPRDSWGEKSGTEIVETDSNLAKTLCITEDQAILLGKVGMELEKAFGLPQDVEWAFHEDDIYLLQSRPITTYNTWTDFELLHEFDTPVLTKQDLFTVANVAEVMPGALTPLSNSTINKVIGDNVYKYLMETDEGPFIQKITGSTHHHAVINVINSFHTKLDDRITMAMKVSDMAVFGHPVVNEEIYAIAKSRFGVMSKLTKMRLLLKLTKDSSKIGKYASRAAKLASQCNLGCENIESALDMLEVIHKSMSVIGKISEYHGRVTHVSVFLQILAMNVLANRHHDLTNDHYYDISLLLSSCANIISAEVPKILETISNTIRDEDISHNFVKIDPNDGVNWLRLNCSKAGEQLDLFLEVHGHRGFREFEVKEDSWAANPSVIIKMLQANCKAARVSKPPEYLSAEDILQRLVTPTSNIVRRILRIILKRCRESVALREKTKSEFVRMINKTRIAFRELANQMVLEAIIPDSQLIYYFSFHELQQVLAGQGTNLIQKAMRRQRLYPHWDKITLPELIFGIPELEEEDASVAQLRNGKSQSRLTGTTICSGDVTGRACVITDLESIGILESGDILITRSTDIGWSPYFPLLSPIVTELGGLISHGAVVAREYGLPCIVGVQNATSVFRTGDKVFLAGRSGTIEVITPDANTK